MFVSVVNGKIGFKDPKVNTIVNTDVEISDDIYNQFFNLQTQGKQFTIKNIYGKTFDEIFEEYTPVVALQQPTIQERVSSIEAVISILMGV